MAIRIFGLAIAVAVFAPLYPSGRALIGMVPRAARAERGPIDQGTDIVVVGGDQFSLLVRELSPDHSDADLPRFGEPDFDGKRTSSIAGGGDSRYTRPILSEDHLSSPSARFLSRAWSLVSCAGWACWLPKIAVRAMGMKFCGFRYTFDCLVVQPGVSRVLAGRCDGKFARVPVDPHYHGRHGCWSICLGSFRGTGIVFRRRSHLDHFGADIRSHAASDRVTAYH